MKNKLVFLVSLFVSYPSYAMFNPYLSKLSGAKKTNQYMYMPVAHASFFTKTTHRASKLIVALLGLSAGAQGMSIVLELSNRPEFKYEREMLEKYLQKKLEELKK